MSKHYAVFGHPVAHSLSPRIHAAFARQAGIALDYRRDRHRPDFAAALRDFAARGGDGANVTLPYKQRAAARLRDAHRARAPRRRGQHPGPQRRRLAWRQHRRRRPGARSHRSPRLDLRAAPHAAARRRWRRARRRPGAARCRHRRPVHRQPQLPSAPTRWPMRSASPAACIRATLDDLPRDRRVRPDRQRDVGRARRRCSRCCRCRWSGRAPPPST